MGSDLEGEWLESGCAALPFDDELIAVASSENGIVALARSSAPAPAVNPFISCIRSSSMQYDASPCRFHIGYLGYRPALGRRISVSIASKLVKCRLD